MRFLFVSEKFIFFFIRTRPRFGGPNEWKRDEVMGRWMDGT